MTGYTVHTGSNEKYAAGWDQIFQGAAKKPAMKKSATKKAAKKANTPKTAKKK